MPYKFNPFTGNLDIEGPIITGTGTVSAAADGTQQVPGINFANDLNTGIYRPAADNLAFSTGGTGRLFIDSSGNLGIGEPSPDYEIHITNSDPVIMIESDGNYGNTSRILFRAKDSNNASRNMARIDSLGVGSNAGALRFFTRNSGLLTEAARFDNQGRLLVGTSSSRTDLIGGTRGGRVQVEAASSSTSDALDNSSLCLTMGSSGPAGSANIFFTRTKSDSLGGVTSVANNDILGGLYFQGTDGTDAVSAALIKAEVDGTPGANDMPGRLVFSTTADGASSPTEAMRIDSSGRLLVGTSTEITDSAHARVQIASSGAGGQLALGRNDSTVTAGNALGIIRFYGNDGGSYQECASLRVNADGTHGNNDKPSRMEFTTTADGASSPTERMRIDSSGRVGIGTTSPATTLDLGPVSATEGPTLRLSGGTGGGSGIPEYPFGTVEFFSNDASGDGAEVKASIVGVADTSSSAPGGELTFSTTPKGTSTSLTERLRIDSSGNVGIGTSSPSERLHLIGSNASASSGTAYNVLRLIGNSTVPANTGGLTFGAYWNNVDVKGRTAYIQSSQGLDAGSTARALLLNPSGGNVGIGTTTPDTLLHLSGLNSGVSTTNALRITDTDTEVTANQVCGRIEFETNDATNPGVNCQIDAVYLGASGAGELQFRTGTAGALIDALRIDSSGNVGIGTTSPGRKLEVNSGSEDVVINAISTDSGAYISFEDNSSTGDTYVRVGAVGDNLRFDAGNAERMRIDSSGRLLVGTSSTSSNAGVVIQGASGGSDGILKLASDNATPADGEALGTLTFSASNHSSSARIITRRDGGTWTAGSSEPTRLEFSTTADGESTPTERMRIKSDGATLIGTTSGIINNSNFGTRISGTGTTIGVFATSRNVGVGGEVALFYGQSGELRIKGDGDCENTNNRYTGISDVKLKENIVDANSQWEDIKALQVRNYNFKEETGYGTHTQIGLVAQEVETVCPGLIGETNDTDDELNETGTTTKSVAYSVLYMKAVKALQEAMDRIETLEAKVAALEAG